VDGGFRPKSLDAGQGDRSRELGFVFSQKGEGIFNLGRESIHCCIETEGKRIVIDEAMSNVKAQSSNEIQNLNGSNKRVLTLIHLSFIWHLDFDI
jgi:hypothetical protein